MVGSRPPQDDPEEPRRARRAAPEPGSAPGPDGGGAPEPGTETPAGSRSRSARESRASSAPAGGRPTSGKQSREREQLRLDRERLRAQTRDENAGATPPTPGSKPSARSKLVVAVAAALVLIVAVGFTVVRLQHRSDPVAGSASTPTTPTSSATATPVLSTQSLLSPAEAKTIDAKKSWTVARDQVGRDDSSPSAACVASSPIEGSPQPALLLLRTLTTAAPAPSAAPGSAASASPSAGGSASPSAGSTAEALLHQAQAYGSEEEAAQAYAITVRAFGTCALPATYISAGATPTGLGDESTALTFTTVGKTDQFRTVVVNRTGRVINIVDAFKVGTPVAFTPVVLALAEVTKGQCRLAEGRCPRNTEVTTGPPPAGGDQVGFLATADLPPAGSDQQPTSVGDGEWNGLDPDDPAPQNSGCEAVDFSATPAESRTARTYLWSRTPARSAFGLDEDILTLESDTAAQALVKKVTTNLRNCSKRQLTATTSGLQKVSGIGTKSAAIEGYVADVTQKADKTTLRYRVAIVSVDATVVYLFLPTDDDLDVTDAQWQTLAVRAGQRATQDA